MFAVIYLKKAIKGGDVNVFLFLCNRNSIPPTTTLEGFHTKLNCARDQCWIDVAFWGGVIPGNQVWYA